MFTLCGLILEAGENVFRDFWSQFSIYFLTFSARLNYLKKGQPTPGRTRAGLLGPAFICCDPAASPSRRCLLTLTPTDPPPPPPPDAVAPPSPVADPAARRRRHRRPSRRPSPDAAPPELLAAAAVMRTEVAAGFLEKKPFGFISKPRCVFLLDRFIFFRFN